MDLAEVLARMVWGAKAVAAPMQHRAATNATRDVETDLIISNKRLLEFVSLADFLCMTGVSEDALFALIARIPAAA